MVTTVLHAWSTLPTALSSARARWQGSECGDLAGLTLRWAPQGFHPQITHSRCPGPLAPHSAHRVPLVSSAPVTASSRTGTVFRAADARSEERRVGEGRGG